MRPIRSHLYLDLCPRRKPLHFRKANASSDTFIAPSETFTDLRRNAQWWLPFLLMTVAGWALVYVRAEDRRAEDSGE